MENVTTPFQVWFDEQGKLVIDEEILSRINMKMGMFKGQEISMIEAYAKAELTERELWEIAKIDTNFNIQNMAMSDMELEREEIIQSLVKLFQGLKFQIVG